MIKNCLACDKEFESYKGVQKLCSEECKKYHRRYMSARNCTFCNESFIPAHGGQYCSDKCRSDNKKYLDSIRHICKQCNGVKTKKTKKRFCSDECEEQFKYESKLKNCKYCNETFMPAKKSQTFCSEQCKYQKNIEENNKKYDGLVENYDFVVCPDCGQKAGEISVRHVKMHGYSSVQEFKDTHGWTTNKGQKYCDNMKGKNNPAYGHGGTLSPFSEKSGRSKEQIEESKRKAQESLAELPSNTSFEYFLNKYNGDEEKAREAHHWRQSNGLKKFKYLYGEEEGYRRWVERNEKWQESLRNSNSTMFKTSAISKSLFGEIEKEIPGILYGDNEKVIRLNPKKLCRVDCVNKENTRVIEFNGDYWHMNPELYESHDVNSRTGKTAQEIWEHDQNRVSQLEDKGYKVMVVWERDYKNDPQATIEECIEFLK